MDMKKESDIDIKAGSPKFKSAASLSEFGRKKSSASIPAYTLNHNARTHGRICSVSHGVKIHLNKKFQVLIQLKPNRTIA